MRLRFVLWLIVMLSPPPSFARIGVDSSEGTYVTIGIFLGIIEEGARIFTPTRLLPFDHPEALGHQFPTALQLFSTEYSTLLLLGEKAGLKLHATLQRYPTQPSDAWPYHGFLAPPIDSLRDAEVIHLPQHLSVIPGLRALAVFHGFPICFIVDTRRLSLGERHMRAPTTMGLDINRADFLSGIQRAIQGLGKSGAVIVLFDGN